MRKSDEQLEQEIIDGLHANPVDTQGITVSVTRGIVTLAGEIKERAAIDAAINAAQRVSGIRAVSVDLGERSTESQRY